MFQAQADHCVTGSLSHHTSSAVTFLFVYFLVFSSDTFAHWNKSVWSHKYQTNCTTMNTRTQRTASHPPNRKQELKSEEKMENKWVVDNKMATTDHLLVKLLSYRPSSTCLEGFTRIMWHKLFVPRLEASRHMQHPAPPHCAPSHHIHQVRTKFQDQNMVSRELWEP